MNGIKHTLFLFVVAVVTLPVHAENNVVYSSVQNTLDVSSQSKATSAVGSAKDWNLSEEEWVKYQKLKEGVQGYLYPNLTPPELLGYFAETNEERNHFAEVYAKIEYSNVDKELKFNQAFHEAAKRLYGNLPIIKPFDVSPYNPSKKQTKETRSLLAGDHLVLIVDVNSSNNFGLLNHAISRINAVDGVVLDIYCVNATNDEVIQLWAKQSAIPVSLVNKNKITLNRFDDRIKRSIQTDTFPSMYLVKNGKTELVGMDDT